MCTVACFILVTNLLRKHIRGYSFQFFPLYSRICKYEFPKRSLYLYWDNFKQSVGLQGFYQFYYTLAKCLAERAHQCDGRYTSLATLYSSPSFSCVYSRQRDSEMAFHLPKIFSQVAQIIFLRPKKIQKQKNRPKMRKMFSFLFE